MNAYYNEVPETLEILAKTWEGQLLMATKEITDVNLKTLVSPLHSVKVTQVEFDHINDNSFFLELRLSGGSAISFTERNTTLKDFILKYYGLLVPVHSLYLNWLHKLDINTQSELETPFWLLKYGMWILKIALRNGDTIAPEYDKETFLAEIDDLRELISKA